jgi:hypothetical protein
MGRPWPATSAAFRLPIVLKKHFSLEKGLHVEGLLVPQHAVDASAELDRQQAHGSRLVVSFFYS